MANQDMQDWEDYQLGVQGTMTGSAYNQAGLDNQPRSYSGTNDKQTAKAKAQPQANKNHKTRTASDSNGLSYLVAAAVWIIAFVVLLPEAGEDSLLTYILPTGAAILAQNYYKAILAVVGVAAAVYFFSL